MFGKSPIKKCHAKLAALYARKHELENMDTVPCEIDSLISEIDAFIEGQYAETVYNHYCASKPKLVRITTGETVSWESAFGSSFDAISKSLRHSLVGLVEGTGRYKIK